MAMDVSKVDVWAVGIDDRPGALHDKLQPLADAGANLAFVIARRSHKNPDREAVAFITPLTGARQINAAKNAGFAKTDQMHTLRLEGEDRPGLGAELTRALAEANVNLHGLAAAALNGRLVVYLSFDSSDEANKAARILRKL
ncbi:MAG: ACT domain-containing protein [Phycisphaeraceae bacterium]